MGIPNRTEAVLLAKKVLTLRNYVQAVERKCYEITADVEQFRVKLAKLQSKGLPSLLTGAGKLVSQDQFANRMATYIENQITASSSTSE